MPNDSEIRQILIDGFERISSGLADLQKAVEDHETRLRKAELFIARSLGALGLLGTLAGLALAVWARIPK